MIKEFLRRSRDKYLLPLRKQVCSLIDKDSRVIDFGCGDGKLLRRLSSKIKFGIGIDKKNSKIRYAEQVCKRQGIQNLVFLKKDVLKDIKENFDYSILMFVLHSLDYNSQKKILNNARKNSNKLIIVDYETPLLLKDKIPVYTDEILAGHYRRFRDYLRRGRIEKLIEKNSFEKFDTSKNYIKIWEIDIRKS